MTAKVGMARLFDPIGDKHVGRAGAAVVAVGAEGDALAVGREHREAVKRLVKGDLHGLSAVDVGHEDVEREGTGFVVGAKEDVLSIRVEIGGPVGTTEVGDLAHFAAVDLAHIQLHLRGLHQSTGEQGEVAVYVLAQGGPAGAPDEVFSVWAEEGAPVVAEFAGDALDVAAVDVAGVEVQVPIAGACKDDFVALGADGRFRIITIAADQQGGFTSSYGYGVDVIPGVDGPDVFVVGPPTRGFWTGRVGRVGRGIQHLLVARHEVGTGGSSQAGAHRCGRRFRGCAIGEVHHVDLVAFDTPAGIGGLKDEAPPVK